MSDIAEEPSEQPMFHYNSDPFNLNSLEANQGMLFSFVKGFSPWEVMLSSRLGVILKVLLGNLDNINQVTIE